MNGEFRNGEIKEGIMWFVDGRYYEGEFVNNVPHGKGRIVGQDGGVGFEGEYEYGLWVKGKGS